jgi:hypothetical protein
VRGVNHGTYRNSVTLGVLGLIAGTDRAINVRNTAWTEVPDSASVDLTARFTLEAWIRPDSVPATGGWATVIAKPEAYALQFNGPRLEVTVIQAGVRRRLLAPSGSIVAGRTYHVVGTYDGAMQRLYINGVQVASRAQTGSVPNVRWPLGIGSWDGIGEHFRGTIDEAAVYSTALSAARVQAHHAAGTTAATAARRRGAARSRARSGMSGDGRSLLGPAQRLTQGLDGPGGALAVRLRSCARIAAAAQRAAGHAAGVLGVRGTARTRMISRARTDARRACATARRRSQRSGGRRDLGALARGASRPADVVGGQQRAALDAGPAVVDGAAAPLVCELDGRPLLPGEVPVAPVHERDERRP